MKPKPLNMNPLLFLFFSLLPLIVNCQLKQTDILNKKHKDIHVIYTRYEGHGMTTYSVLLIYKNDLYDYISDFQSILLDDQDVFDKFKNDFISAVNSNVDEGESLSWANKEYTIYMEGDSKSIILFGKKGKGHHKLSKSEIKQLTQWLSKINFGSDSLKE